MSHGQKWRLKTQKKHLPARENVKAHVQDTSNLAFGFLCKVQFLSKRVGQTLQVARGCFQQDELARGIARDCVQHSVYSGDVRLQRFCSLMTKVEMVSLGNVKKTEERVNRSPYSLGWRRLLVHPETD
jgi:hypothetical protein